MLIKKQYTKLELILAYFFIFMVVRAAECYNIRDYEMLIILPLVMVSTYVLLQEVVSIVNIIIKRKK